MHTFIGCQVRLISAALSTIAPKELKNKLKKILINVVEIISLKKGISCLTPPPPLATAVLVLWENAPESDPCTYISVCRLKCLPNTKC